MAAGRFGLHGRLVLKVVEQDYKGGLGLAKTLRPPLTDTLAKGHSKKPCNVTPADIVQSMDTGVHGHLGRRAQLPVESVNRTGLDLALSPLPSLAE